MKKGYLLILLIISCLKQAGAIEIKDSTRIPDQKGMALLSAPITSYTTTRNFVVERVHLDPSSGVSDRTFENVIYLDGLGRKLQEIQVGAAPGRTDIILPYVYGIHGRVEKKYIPYGKTGNNGAFDVNATSPSNWDIHGVMDAPYAFTRIDYDNSPLDRTVKQTGPGMNWHVNQKGVSMVYGTNDANRVKLFRVSSDGTLQVPGYYAAGSLQKVTVTDEDGKQVETYTDNMERTVLTVSVKGESNRFETYSVYDDRGLLRYILSPEASAGIGSMATRATDMIRKFGFYYEYDRFGRLILKQLPGCESVYMVYDNRDRLVMSQDGNQRAANADKWSYSLYDKLNRVAETGEIVLTGDDKTHAALQEAASGRDDYIPSGTRFPLQYTLYDNYTDTTNVPVLTFQATTGYALEYRAWVTGFVTSVKTKVLGESPEKWLTTTTYYDDRCRVIQTVSDNIEGFISRVDVKYDFVGNVIQQKESHQVSSNRRDVLESVNSYDDRGRLLSTMVKLNDGIPTTETYTYDVVGRLTKKTRGSVEETMTYNARGWLTGKTSIPFKMKLRYENPMGGADTCWNGNISEWEWQHGTNTALMYSFTYDGINRLKETTQKQKSGTSWAPLAESYLEREISYDRNGNIKTLQRTARGTMVDNLIYNYTGNQLTRLTESVRDEFTGNVYTRGSSAEGSYTYDNNGNMITDSRKALSLSYNVLNLLSDIKTTSGTLKAKYLYLADGTKLRVHDDGETNGFDYLGSLTYRKNSAGLQLESANFETGVILMNSSASGGSEVNYFLTDHLGSVRVIVDGNGIVQERNDYYPFGARHVKDNYLQRDGNRYKYNGKEEQTTGDLDYLDYGARMGDVALGRWFNMDPLSEKYLSKSPYHFSGNNPIVFVDLNGMDYWTTSDPTQIALFFEMLSGQRNESAIFDYSEWAHFNDDDVLDLWYNDQTYKIYSSYSTIIEGEAARIGVSLTADELLSKLTGSAYVHSKEKLIKMEIERQLWHEKWARKSGAIKQDYTLDGLFIPIGKGLGMVSSWVGKLAGKSASTFLKYSSKTIDDAVNYAMKAKAHHIFGKAAHNLDALVVKMGGQENTIRAVLKAANGKLPKSGIFEDVVVNVEGFKIYIRGNVIDGIPKLGTMFIK